MTTSSRIYLLRLNLSSEIEWTKTRKRERNEYEKNLQLSALIVFNDNFTESIRLTFCSLSIFIRREWCLFALNFQCVPRTIYLIGSRTGYSGRDKQSALVWLMHIIDYFKLHNYIVKWIEIIYCEFIRLAKCNLTANRRDRMKESLSRWKIAKQSFQ